MSSSIPCLVTPEELVFEADSAASLKRVLRVFNPYEFPLTFVVRSTYPTHFRVEPARGVLQAGSSTNVVVQLRAENLHDVQKRPSDLFKVDVASVDQTKSGSKIIKVRRRTHGHGHGSGSGSGSGSGRDDGSEKRLRHRKHGRRRHSGDSSKREADDTSKTATASAAATHALSSGVGRWLPLIVGLVCLFYVAHTINEQNRTIHSRVSTMAGQLLQCQAMVNAREQSQQEQQQVATLPGASVSLEDVHGDVDPLLATFLTFALGLVTAIAQMKFLG